MMKIGSSAFPVIFINLFLEVCVMLFPISLQIPHNTQYVETIDTFDKILMSAAKRPSTNGIGISNIKLF